MSRSHFAQSIQELQQQHAYRIRKTLESPQGVSVFIDGKPFISFCSNDYLGLANDPRLANAASAAIKNFGVGSGASQLISGYSKPHAELEAALADFFQVEQALLFSSGFLTNLGVLNSLSTKSTLILQDRLNHASLIDGAMYSEGQLKRYRHLDVNHAAELIADTAHQELIIASDGVFSMEGTLAPISQLISLKHQHNGLLIVDDAHGIGVMGNHGKGIVEHYKLAVNELDLLIGTFGKAFGSSGAFVAGSKDIIDYLIQTSRTLIYTTAMPAMLAAAAQTSLDIIKNEPSRRKKLHDNIAYFKSCANNAGIVIQDSITPIQTIIIGDNQKTLQASEQLSKQGILVIAIRPPTVPKNTARLRITFSSEHSYAQIDKLIAALQDINA